LRAAGGALMTPPSSSSEVRPARVSAAPVNSCEARSASRSEASPGVLILSFVCGPTGDFETAGMRLKSWAKPFGARVPRPVRPSSLSACGEGVKAWLPFARRVWRLRLSDESV